MTGIDGVLNSIVDSAGAKASAAGFIKLQWNGALPSAYQLKYDTGRFTPRAAIIALCSWNAA